MIEQTIVPLVSIIIVIFIISQIQEAMRNHARNQKSVETLINEVKGYGKSQSTPLETQARQIIRDGQQQVEEEIATLFEDVLTTKDKETNNQ